MGAKALALKHKKMSRVGQCWVPQTAMPLVGDRIHSTGARRISNSKHTYGGSHTFVFDSKGIDKQSSRPLARTKKTKSPQFTIDSRSAHR